MKSRNFPIFSVINSRAYLLIMAVVASVFFSVSYYIMATFVGNKNNMCMIGAALTWQNVIFSAILSVLNGIMIAGIVKLVLKRKISYSGTSFLGFGTLIGIFTLFCTLCALPVVSIAGLSLGLGIFTVYNGAFKVISLLLILVGLYMLNKKLDSECIYDCNVSKNKTRN